MKRLLLQKVSSRRKATFMRTPEIKPFVQQGWFRTAFVIAGLRYIYGIRSGQHAL